MDGMDGMETGGRAGGADGKHVATEVLRNMHSELFCVERRARDGGLFVAYGPKAKTKEAAQAFAADTQERMGGTCRVVREVKVDFREVVG